MPCCCFPSFLKSKKNSKDSQTKDAAALMDTLATTLEESKLMPNKCQSQCQAYQELATNTKSMNSTVFSFKTANSSLVADETGIIDYTEDSIQTSSHTGSTPSTTSVSSTYFLESKTTPIRRRKFFARTPSISEDSKNLAQTATTIDCTTDQEYAKFFDGIHESPLQYQDRLGRNQSMRRYSSAVVERKNAYNPDGGLRNAFGGAENLKVNEQLQQPSLLLMDTQKDEDSSQLDVSFDFEPLNLSSQYACVNEQTKGRLIIKPKQNFDGTPQHRNWEHKFINENKYSLDKRRSRPRFRQTSMDIPTAVLPFYILYPQYNPNIVYMEELREKLPFARKQLRPTNLASQLYEGDVCTALETTKNLDEKILNEDNTQTIENEEDFALNSPILCYYSDDELWINTPVNTSKIKERTLSRLSNSFRTARDFERDYRKSQQEFMAVTKF